MVQILCVGPVCGSVISLTLLTGDLRVGTILASVCLKMAKTHLRAFALPLFLCPTAERQRQEKDRRERMLGVERKRRRTRRVVGLS